ncbi:class I SAM-dependent methyltransferase [Sulfobacillus harzensis]|uniref:Methyltransferase domain-containing protein n=1 Tax=Sulfobacillus harzensis TaxID=2729629 RepID=A0A7Y0L597_9FIRM|nr:methyltransferase domain-containing protein [Sulfobacillus harzensis]NMP23212.1 methyltransferase domain-containing protein [Sulfobacillus harzensis]
MAEHDHHHHHHGPWTHEQLQHLENPEREKLMPREPVLAALNPQLGEKIADVGAGLGWLTFPLAVAVGESGAVLAIDPSQDGIRAIRDKAQQQQLPQVETLERSAEDTGLPADYVDGILWHTMYHDVGNRPRAIGEMFRILKSGGRWVIVDWVKENTESGPPITVRLSPDEVRSEVETAGFQVTRQWKAGPVTWGLTVEKP